MRTEGILEQCGARGPYRQCCQLTSSLKRLRQDEQELVSCAEVPNGREKFDQSRGEGGHLQSAERTLHSMEFRQAEGVMWLCTNLKMEGQWIMKPFLFLLCLFLDINGGYVIFVECW